MIDLALLITALLLLVLLLRIERILLPFYFTVSRLSEDCALGWKKTQELLRAVISLARGLRPFTRTGSKKRAARARLKPLFQTRHKPVTIFPLPFTVKLKYFIFGTVFSCLFIFLPLATVIFLQDLPSPRELTLQQIPQTTKIYDRNGTLLTELYASQNRTLVPLSAIPQSLQDATLAIEDKNFYQHPGFDILSILRAFKEDISGHKIQGGSTITQQLIKSSMLTPEQSIARKIKEIVLAFWAERIYNKKQILDMYFNQVPYGGTAWGVEAASEIYFNKHVKDLDLAQSAFLAGLTSAPTTFSPYGPSPTLWKFRQKEVLARMQALGYITKAEEVKATQEKLVFARPTVPLHAPHFVDYIKDLLIKKYGLAMVEKGGLTVRTTLDLATQDMAQQIVEQEVENDSYLHLTNGAVVVSNPQNGDILAMVGSHDYRDPNGGQVNVTTALRQPGSSVKIITYAAALSHGFTAASILKDTPETFTSPDGGPAYSPVNYDGTYKGNVPLRIAFANSLNLPAVKTLQKIGVPTMLSFARKMGISDWNNTGEYGLSLTLGAADTTMLEMDQVYSTVANGGRRVDLDPILKITDSRGNVIEKKTATAGKQVISPGVAYIISNILADNKARSLEFGPNSPLSIPGHTVSVKTGTSDNKRDNWTIGYTDNFVVTVWVGNNDNSPMSQTLASGITGAAPIWHAVMSSLLAKHPETPPSMPENIVVRMCFGHEEYFLSGTDKNVPCSPRAFSSTSGRQEIQTGQANDQAASAQTAN